LRTDDEPIRAQSTILYKNNLKLSLLLTITVFLVRMVCIRTKNTVGARSAQWPLDATTLLETPYSEALKRGGTGVNCRRMQALGLPGNADDAGR